MADLLLTVDLTIGVEKAPYYLAEERGLFSAFFVKILMGITKKALAVK